MKISDWAKNVRIRIRTMDLLAEAASVLPSDLSRTNLVELSHPANLNDFSIWSETWFSSTEEITGKGTPEIAGYEITLD